MFSGSCDLCKFNMSNVNQHECIILQNELYKFHVFMHPAFKKKKKMLAKLNDAETFYQLNDGSLQLKTVKLCIKQQHI